MILLQLKGPPPNDSVVGLYAKAHLARKAQFDYHPFHPQCWDVPTWAADLGPYIPNPDFRLVDTDRVSLPPYEIVFGSVMAANAAAWQRIVRRFPYTYFHLGGYTRIHSPNVWWIDNLYNYTATLRQVGNFYPQMGDTINGARITLSNGCNHHCTFCTIPHPVTPLSPQEIIRQVGPLIGKKVGVVYVDDKTFGQSQNHDKLYWWVGRYLKPTGFVVQTTALQVAQVGVAGLRRWRRMGIFAVEMGVESYNDPILRAYRKPANEALIRQACDYLAEADLLVCPNIIVGMEGETTHTYDKTSRFMEQVPNLGWFSIFCLADYTKDDSDADESVPVKSWHAHPTTVEYGFRLLYGTATRLMGGYDTLRRNPIHP